MKNITTGESLPSLPLRPMADTTHDGIYQRLVVVNDPAEAVEERHGGTDPAVAGESASVLGAKADQIRTSIARLQQFFRMRNTWSYKARVFM